MASDDFGELKHILLRQIDTDPGQPRKTFKDRELQDLMHSMEFSGLVQPITVKHSERPHRYVIVAGERRFRSATKLGWERIPCIVKPKDQDTYIQSLVENFNRVDLNPIEEALAYKEMREQRGMTWAQIEKIIQRSVPTMIAKLKLLTLPQEIQQMIIENRLPQERALNFTGRYAKQSGLIRLAHELIAGNDPTELHIKETTAAGQSIMKGKLPTNPQQMLHRIVSQAWQARSLNLVVEKFLQLPENIQRDVLKGMRDEPRRNLIENLKAMSLGCRAFAAAMERLEKSSVEEVISKPSGPTNEELAAIEDGAEEVEDDEVPDPITPRFSTPVSRRSKPAAIEPPKRGSGWTEVRTAQSRPERKPVFTTLPDLSPIRAMVPPPASSKPRRESIDLTKIPLGELDEAAELLSRMFNFRGSAVPNVQINRHILSKMTGISEDALQQKAIQALRMLREIWSDGASFEHTSLKRVAESFKMGLHDGSFEDLFAAVPVKTNDDKFLTFESFH